MRFVSALATVLGLHRSTDDASSPPGVLPLDQAAEMALARLKQEGQPLARLASMGRTDAEARIWLRENMRRNVHLAAGQSLPSIASTELEAYLRWARSVA